MASTVITATATLTGPAPMREITGPSTSVAATAGATRQSTERQTIKRQPVRSRPEFKIPPRRAVSLTAAAPGSRTWASGARMRFIPKP